MATYVNDLRLKEIATGDESGTWGTSTNTNLELIAEAFSFGTEAITTNADTHTTTIADGATDPGRSLFLKYTGTLDSACTITIGPNTVSKLWFIENATSGSQNIIISQGSGANITIPPGDTKAVYSDGAGSGAAIIDAFASLSVVDLKVQDDLTVTDDMTVGGTLGVTGVLTATSLDISGDIDVDGTANLDVVDIDGATNIAAAVTMATNNKIQFRDDAIHISSTADGQLDLVADTEIQIAATTIDVNGNLDVSGTTVSAGKITADAGIDIDNFNIDGTTIALSSGNFTLDVAGEIELDADGGKWIFKDDGTTVGSILASGGDGIIVQGVATGSGLLFHNSDALLPAQNGNAVDATIDLGRTASSAFRFKDLYLSGNAFVGAILVNTTSNSSLGTLVIQQLSDTKGLALIDDSASNTFFMQNLGSEARLAHNDNTPMTFQTNSTERMSINGSGDLALGVSTAAARLHIRENANKTEADAHFRIEGAGYSGFHWLDGTAYYIGQNSGSRSVRIYSSAESAGVNLAASATSFAGFSDERLKYDVEPIENALESLRDLRTVKYRLKDVDEPDSQKKIGLVAQDLVGVLPEVVEPIYRPKDDTEYMAVRYTEIVPVLVKAIQEQQTMIEALTARIETLEA